MLLRRLLLLLLLLVVVLLQLLQTKVTRVELLQDSVLRLHGGLHRAGGGGWWRKMKQLLTQMEHRGDERGLETSSGIRPLHASSL